MWLSNEISWKLSHFYENHLLKRQTNRSLSFFKDIYNGTYISASSFYLKENCQNWNIFKKVMPRYMQNKKNLCITPNYKTPFLQSPFKKCSFHLHLKFINGQHLEERWLKNSTETLIRLCKYGIFSKQIHIYSFSSIKFFKFLLFWNKCTDHQWFMHEFYWDLAKSYVNTKFILIDFKL